VDIYAPLKELELRMAYAYIMGCRLSNLTGFAAERPAALTTGRASLKGDNLVILPLMPALFFVVYLELGVVGKSPRPI
jgi:hypothetical protein